MGFRRRALTSYSRLSVLRTVSLLRGFVNSSAGCCSIAIGPLHNRGMPKKQQSSYKDENDQAGSSRAAPPRSSKKRPSTLKAAVVDPKAHHEASSNSRNQKRHPTATNAETTLQKEGNYIYTATFQNTPTRGSDVINEMSGATLLPRSMPDPTEQQQHQVHNRDILPQYYGFKASETDFASRGTTPSANVSDDHAIAAVLDRKVGAAKESDAVDSPDPRQLPPAVAKPYHADDIRENIQRQMIQSAVSAKVIEEDQISEADSTDLEGQREEERQRRKQVLRRRIIYVILFLVVAIVVVVPVVVTNNKSSSNSTRTVPTLSPTRAPSVAKNALQPVGPPQYVPTELNQNDSGESIFAVIQTGINHSLLVSYLGRTHLDGYLNNYGIYFTVFAPTDASWRTFAAASVAYTYYTDVSNPYWIDHLNFLLEYHIVTKSLLVSNLLALHELPTLSGLSLPVNQSNGQLGDNSAIIVAPDIPANNGNIDVPDKVLVATQLNRTIIQSINTSDSSAKYPLTTLAQLILSSAEQDATLLNTLSNSLNTGLTLLAPSDYAFNASNWTSNVYNTAGNATLTSLLLENHVIYGNLYNFEYGNLYNFESASPLTLLTSLSGFSMWVASNGRNKTTCNGALVEGTTLVQNG